MYFDLLNNPETAQTIDLWVMLGFIGVLILSYKNWRVNPSVFITSIILFGCFVVANNTFEYFWLSDNTQPDYNFYLTWLQFDVLAIIAIISVHLITRVRFHKATSAIMYLLAINTVTYLSMHIDIMVLENREAWWLWTWYTPSILLVEFTIIITLATISILEIKKQVISQ
ncbi:hypothetical protein [Colwellia psychrerythraea]|uniref:Uncharacterized protein n=1 Tax=Colwellia psychrerythraea TaxID=28229 RepID=A0A099KBP1_COLPS|nr:hypothetical protein [Colwellia psychrerythraea]KGJ87730.1 hypothetical protein GAB14E_4408 [Colwellia psychrerythraea]